MKKHGNVKISLAAWLVMKRLRLRLGHHAAAVSVATAKIRLRNAQTALRQSVKF